MLSWETMLRFESIWLADTSQFSSMPHSKTNSFCTFGGLYPCLWMTFPKVLILVSFSTFFNFDEVKIYCHFSTSAFMYHWERLSLTLCYWSRGWYFVLELAAVEAAPKGQEDEFCQAVVATQGNLFSSAQCLQGFRWLTLGSAESPPKSHLCCSRSGFDYSVKHCPFDILVRKAWTEPSRFYSIPRAEFRTIHTYTYWEA